MNLSFRLAYILRAKPRLKICDVAANCVVLAFAAGVFMVGVLSEQFGWFLLGQLPKEYRQLYLRIIPGLVVFLPLTVYLFACAHPRSRKQQRQEDTIPQSEGGSCERLQVDPCSERSAIPLSL